jgi:sulfur-oxidizing protein SoxY
MTNTRRRVFLKATLAAGTAAVAVQAGLLAPGRLLAAWPADAFTAREYESSLQAALGTTSLPPGDIQIHAPEIAENGAMVAVTVESAMPEVTEMALFVVRNGQPMTAKFVLGPDTLPTFSVRVKMAETSDVVAAVKSGGAWYGTAREVKVTLGGCGG